MKPIIIVVEGLTEKEFVDNCLAPYLRQTYNNYGWQIAARVLGKPGKKGGRVAFSRIKTDVVLLLKERADAVVSMLVDFYGMQTDFPNYESCLQLNQTSSRIDCIEQGLNQAIDSRRFIAYFQQYEFEALLFAAGNSYNAYLNEITCQAIADIRKAVTTPEEINTSNPPSYRLIEVFQNTEGVSYKKTFHGPILALELGIEAMLADCPRFANWVRSLVQLAQLP